MHEVCGEVYRYQRVECNKVNFHFNQDLKSQHYRFSTIPALSLLKALVRLSYGCCKPYYDLDR